MSIRTRVTAVWKLAAILNKIRHFESDKKKFFHEICGCWELTISKRENMKMFNFDRVTAKKPNLSRHFEYRRHFETRQNFTCFRNGNFYTYIEVNFGKIWRKSEMYIFRYIGLSKPVFLKKMFHFCSHRGAEACRTYLISILNERSEIFT